jgi:hypothetical protein
MGIPFSENGASVIITFIAPVRQNILWVVHPPVKNMRRSKIPSSSIYDLPAAAIGIAPIGLPMGIEADPFPGPGTIRGSMSVHTITGHVLSVIPGSLNEGIKRPEGIQPSVPASFIDPVEDLLFFNC